MKLKVKKLSSKAKIPEYAHAGDACFDLSVLIDDDNRPMYVVEGSFVELAPLRDAGTHCFVIEPDDSIVFRTGLSFEIPDGHVMLIHVRSSTGIKSNLILSNGTGVIDSGYRGEVRIALMNIGWNAVTLHDGDRVAQAMIIPYPAVEIVESDVLSESERGMDGIGSTGIK